MARHYLFGGHGNRVRAAVARISSFPAGARSGYRRVPGTKMPWVRLGTRKRRSRGAVLVRALHRRIVAFRRFDVKGCCLRVLKGLRSLCEAAGKAVVTAPSAVKVEMGGNIPILPVAVVSVSIRTDVIQ